MSKHAEGMNQLEQELMSQPIGSETLIPSANDNSVNQVKPLPRTDEEEKLFLKCGWAPDARGGWTKIRQVDGYEGCWCE